RSGIPLMTNRTAFTSLLASALAVTSACRSSEASGEPVLDEVARAASTLTANDLLAHMRVLASDEFEGRAPGTEGDRKTVEYLVEQFRELGLEPGNPDGTYVQRVPLMGFETSSQAA